MITPKRKMQRLIVSWTLRLTIVGFLAYFILSLLGILPVTDFGGLIALLWLIIMAILVVVLAIIDEDASTTINDDCWPG